jgi:hypothetical protein
MHQWHVPNLGGAGGIGKSHNLLVQVRMQHDI